MESRFANQSEDQVRREQENILKEIQQGQKKAEREKGLGEHHSGVGQQPLDEHWVKNENQSKLNNHVSCATIEVNKHIEGVWSSSSYQCNMCFLP